MINRRLILQNLALASGALFVAPGLAVANVASERRFVFIIQRGAADGLATIIPTGDPDLPRLRAALIPEGGEKLDAMFTAHPALVDVGQLYSKQEALFVHAVASPYRDRSHFDAQNVLETGGAAAYQLKDGWLNRFLTLLPQEDAQAIAVSATIPTALRGPMEVTSYAPSSLPEAPDDLKARVGSLYANDAQLSELWKAAMSTEAMAGAASAIDRKRDASAIGTLAAKLLSGPGSARIAMIETSGWDTHYAQPARLTAQLKQLDATIAALKSGLAGTWSQTLVLVATEFGRTAAANGTGGTDHGTASVAMLIGGSVKGGRVIADWPGLGAAQLYEGRDLKPTVALDQLMASALAEHYSLDSSRVSKTLFPQTPQGPAITGLIRI